MLQPPVASRGWAPWRRTAADDHAKPSARAARHSPGDELRPTNGCASVRGTSEPAEIGPYRAGFSPRAFASAASVRTEKPGVCEYSSVAVVGNGFALARSSTSFSGEIAGEPRRSQGSYW